MVKIVYNGPIGTHLVVSPLRRVPTYGLHTRGDIFEVDEKDQKAKPDIFVLVEEPKKAAPREVVPAQDAVETIMVDDPAADDDGEEVVVTEEVIGESGPKETKPARKQRVKKRTIAKRQN